MFNKCQIILCLKIKRNIFHLNLTALVEFNCFRSYDKISGKISEYLPNMKLDTNNVEFLVSYNCFSNSKFYLLSFLKPYNYRFVYVISFVLTLLISSKIYSWQSLEKVSKPFIHNISLSLQNSKKCTVKYFKPQ